MVILIFLNITLAQAESLAVKNAPEIKIMEERLKAMESEYKALLFSFLPSLYIKGDIPSIRYYSDEIYYPGSSYPIPYWQRYEKKGGEVGISCLLPFGGEANISYSLYRNEEYYNLYEDREYYERRLNISLSQPIFGVSASWDRLKEKRNEIEAYKISIKKKRREVIKEVIINYVNLWVSEKEKILIKNISKSARFSEKRLNYLYKNGLVDRVEYLRSKGKYGILAVEEMEAEGRFANALYNLKSLTGCDSIIVSEPELPEIEGEPLPDEYFTLSRLYLEKEKYLLKKSQLKRGLFPSLYISLSLGLRGKGDWEDTKSMKKNTYNIEVEVNFPLFNPASHFAISGNKHRINSIERKIEEMEKKVKFEKEEMIKKKVEIKRKIAVLKGSLEVSEEILRSKDMEFLPFHERVEIINDYINALKSYGEAMKEYLLLNAEFEPKGVEEK